MARVIFTALKDITEHFESEKRELNKRLNASKEEQYFVTADHLNTRDVKLLNRKLGIHRANMKGGRKK